MAENDSKPEVEAELEQGRMTFGEHLEELRRRIIFGLIGIGICMVGTLYYGRVIIGILIKPLNHVQHKAGLPEVVVAPSPTSAFAIYLKISILCAFVIGVPWLVYQLWKFIETGLYTSERKVAYILAPFSTLMTVLGILFMYYLMLPVCLTFLVVFATTYPKSQGDDSSIFDVITDSVRMLTETTKSDESENGDTDSGTNGKNKLQPNDSNKGKETQPPNPSDVGPNAPKNTQPKTGTAPEPNTTTRTDAFIVPSRDKDPPNPEIGELWFSTVKNELVMYVVDSNGKGKKITFKPALSSVLWPLFNIEAYISFVIMITIGVIIGFQLPVVMLVVGWSGIIDPAKLSASRKYAFLISFIAGAMLTPADPISMGVLAIPLYLLFELGLFLMHRTYTRKTPDEDEDSDGDDGDKGNDSDSGDSEPAPA